MPGSRLLLAALAVAALVPSTARADPPWSAPATIPGTFGYWVPVVITNAGNGVIAAPRGPDLPALGTVLTAVSVDGRVGPGRQVDLTAGWLATYGSDHIALAGTRPASNGAEQAAATVELATGTPADGVGAPRALPGTRGHQLYALAASASGTIALVTGKVTGRRERVVWIRRGGALKRVLTIRVSDQARGAAVAVGSHGDVLVVWEDHDQIRTRHIGRTGHAGPVHRLGAGVQSAIQARYDDSGRQEIAWESQGVSEGDATTPATISYTSAARGHGFTAARVVGRDDITGTGNYVSAPGVRLVGSGSDSSVLAFTVYDGAHFRVQVADVAAGRVQTPQTVSPDGEDAVLGDLAYARAGGTLVLWRSGTRGSDASGPQRVFASARGAGLPAFGAPEAVSEPIDPSSPATNTLPYAPFAAVDPKTGAALAAFGYLGPRVAVSARPSLR
jgi:hypothetical protein